MYKSRKKILLVAGTSAVVLAGFGVGSWAIVDSSNRIPIDNKVKSELSGATAYLGDTSFVYKQMSIDDWMLYNFPKFAIPSESNGTTTIDFYSSLNSYSQSNGVTQDILDKSKQNLLFTVKLNTNKTHFEVWTSRYQDTTNFTGIMLVSSDTTISDGSLTIANKYYWDSKVETFNLNKNADSYNGSSPIDPKSSVTYKNESQSGNGNQNGNNKTYSTEVKSNTDTVLWNRKFTQANSSSKNFTLEYSSSSLSLANKQPIKQTFNYTDPSTNGDKETEVKKMPYYTINYTSGSSNTQINEKSAFITAIQYEKKSDGTINSSVSSGYEYSFLPVVQLDTKKNN